MLASETITRNGAAAPRFASPLETLTGLAVFALTLSFGPLLLNDPDSYWQITVGQWILTRHAVPDREVFSYTMHGAPWIVHEWLAEAGIADVYDLFDWAGLVVVAALALAATITLLLRALLRYLEPSYALIGAISAWGLLLPHSLARPHLFAMPILMAWIALLVAARAAERAPSPWWALLMVPWANLHGGFVLGDALIVMFAGEMVLDQPDWAAVRRQVSAWARFLVLSILAGCLTPNGVAGLLLPFRLIAMHTVMTSVVEWQSPNFQMSQPLEPWLMLALLGALTFGVKLPVTRVAMLLVLLHETLVHQRFADVLGLAAPLIVAPALTTQLPSLAATMWGGRFARLARPGRVAGTALATAVALGLAGVPICVGIRHDSGRFAPAAAVAYARQHGISGPVFNAFNFGGYLIFCGIAPFIDSRAELYGEAFTKRAEDIASLPGTLTQYHIAWTIFEPKDPRAAMLDELVGWKRVYADDLAIVHVRNTAP
jgi:hypothetical protein